LLGKVKIKPLLIGSIVIMIKLISRIYDLLKNWKRLERLINFRQPDHAITNKIRFLIKVVCQFLKTKIYADLEFFVKRLSRLKSKT